MSEQETHTMSERKEPGLGTKKQHLTVFGIGAVWAVGLVVASGAIAVALWAFGVFTSDIKGAGDAIKQRNQAVTRIQKQELFEQLSADYTGYLTKIEIAVTAVADASPVDRPFRQTELEGLRLACVDSAQQFNAESRKYTARVWKSAGLPVSLDTTACAT